MNNTESIDFSHFLTEKNLEKKIDAKLIKYDFPNTISISKIVTYEYSPLSLKLQYSFLGFCANKDDTNRCKKYIASLGKENISDDIFYFPFRVGDFFDLSKLLSSNSQFGDPLTTKHFNQDIIYVISICSTKDITLVQETLYEKALSMKDHLFGKVHFLFLDIINVFYAVEVPDYITTLHYVTPTALGYQSIEEMSVETPILLINRKKIIKYIFYPSFPNIKEKIDKLLKDDDAMLPLEYPFPNNYSNEEYKRQVTVLQSYIEEMIPYVAPEKIHRHISFLFLFFLKNQQFIYSSNYFKYEGKSYTKEQFPIEAMTITKKYQELLKTPIKARYQCKVDYKKEKYLLVIRNGKCSNCKINVIGKKEPYAVCVTCQRMSSQYGLCSKCIQLLINGNKLIHEHPLILITDRKYIDNPEIFPLFQKEIKGYVTTIKCAHCKNQLKDYDFYWKCIFCYKIGYCNNCYIKLRNKKIDKDEYEHPYIMLIKGWKGKSLSFYHLSMV